MSPRAAEESSKNEFLAGVCVALQCVTAFDSGVLWGEIVRAVGKTELINYASNTEPDEWSLAGFSKYAFVELEFAESELPQLRSRA